jgi:uncharacterized DUF497 family protein
MSAAFDWDEANLSHIALHDVMREEAEAVVLNNPLDLDYSDWDSEERFRQVGETLAGRVLVVITTERGTLIRVVTAYPPSAFLKGVYLRFRESLIYGKAGRT